MNAKKLFNTLVSLIGGSVFSMNRKLDKLEIMVKNADGDVLDIADVTKDGNTVYLVIK